jgi:hypothetical protein
LIYGRYYPGTPLAGLAKLSATAPTSLGNQGNPQPESGDNHAVPIQPSAWVLKASNADDNVSIDASPASTPKKSKQSSDRANPQPNEIGPPVEPPDSQFAKAEDPWKIVSQVLNDTISHAALLKSTGGDAQAVLNILQKVLDSESCYRLNLGLTRPRIVARLPENTGESQTLRVRDDYRKDNANTILS